MKTFGKVVKVVAVTAAGLSAVAALALAVLLEPRVPVRGFATLDETKLNVRAGTLTFLDGEGDEIEYATLFRQRTELSAVPERVSQAFIAIEDKRFYSHRGVDFYRIAGATVKNLASRSFKEGASTITQQLVKNTHLKAEKTIARKLQEIRIARQIERKYSKREILEAYFNVLYFGNNAYGLNAAAALYFGKKPSELSLGEGATLAGIINAPSAYNPFKKPKNAVKRRNLVLEKMRDCGFITEDERAAACAEPLKISEPSDCDEAFLSAAAEELELKLKTSEEEIVADGLTVKTALDRSLNATLGEIVAKYAGRIDEYGYVSAIVLNENAEFIALASSDRSKSIFEKRQPASTIKPLLCYAPALERGEIYACTPILDEPTSFSGWSPSNYKDVYHGWTDVEQSLALSLNIPAVKVLETVGLDNAKAICSRFGISFTASDDSLALALGCMQNGVSLPDIATAYSALARGGRFIRGGFVTTAKRGKNSVYSRSNASVRAVSDETAFLVTTALQTCAKRGTAKQVGYAGKNLAAKTGTAGGANGNTDAYCVAYSPSRTVAVRISAADGKLLPNDVAGGTLPAKICKDVFRAIGDDGDFDVPDGIVEADIDLTALERDKKVLLAGDDVPAEDRKTVIFDKLHVPTAYSKRDEFFGDDFLDDFYHFKIFHGFVY